MAAPRKDDVAKLILDSTETLLKTKALSDISLAEIARQAGLPRVRYIITIKIKTKSSLR